MLAGIALEGSSEALPVCKSIVLYCAPNESVIGPQENAECTRLEKLRIRECNGTLRK